MYCYGLPNACSLSIASASFAKRFSGLPLISVIHHGTSIELSLKLRIFIVIPIIAAGLPGEISLTSADELLPE